MNAISDNVLSFSIADFNVLEEVIEILEPFADITVIYQSANITTHWYSGAYQSSAGCGMNPVPSRDRT